MDKKWLQVIIIITISFTMLFYVIPFHLTSLIAGNVSVSVNYLLKGDITSLIFTPVIGVGVRQNISTEFTNIGSRTINATINIKIHKLFNASLTERASYTDSLVQLYPGSRRHYATVFIPNETGVYFIQIRVPYLTQVAELWGVFFVPGEEVVLNQTPSTTGVGGTGGGGTPTTVTPVLNIEELIPDFSLVYENKITVIKGDSTLFKIDITNIGNVPVANVKLFTSVSELLDLSINPKEIRSIDKSKASFFIISITPLGNIDPGNYTLSFSVISDTLKKSGQVTVEVIEKPISLRDYVYGLLLNYQLLIIQIKGDIAETKLRGFDVSAAEIYIEEAENRIIVAREFFGQEKYEDALQELKAVKENIEKAVFSLSLAGTFFLKAQAFPWLFIVIIIALSVFVSTVIYRKHKKKKSHVSCAPKPKRNEIRIDLT